MSNIDKIILKLFTERWVGESVLKDIGTMRAELYKNMKDQMNGYWSGHTAYHIMIDGGFIVDDKPVNMQPKKATILGQMFINDFESKGANSSQL